jgi:hypothetical protein
MTPSTCPSEVAYTQLLAQKGEIEREFGSELHWFELPDKSVSAISTYLENVDFTDSKSQPEQYKWILSSLEAFDRVFRHRIRNLNLDDPAPFEGDD